MAPPITPDRRAAIAAAIRANLDAEPRRSRAAIAAEHGVAGSTVAAIAREHGIADPFDTTRTRRATQSAGDRRRARRSALADRMIAEAEQFLDQLHGPFLVFSFGGKENEYNEHTLDGPPTGDIRNLMTSAAIAVDKHLALDRHDATSGHEDTTGVLAQLSAELAAAVRPPGIPTEEAP